MTVPTPTTVMTLVLVVLVDLAVIVGVVHPPSDLMGHVVIAACSWSAGAMGLGALDWFCSRRGGR